MLDYYYIVILAYCTLGGAEQRPRLHEAKLLAMPLIPLVLSLLCASVESFWAFMQKVRKSEGSDTYIGY